MPAMRMIQLSPACSRIAILLTVFMIVGNAFAWSAVEQSIYKFTGFADGEEPNAGLVADSEGNLYGTTASGGLSSFCGTAFELTPPATLGGSWTKTTLYSFQGGDTDGCFPSSTLIFDKLGNLYGTTDAGGPMNRGTVFELSSPATSGVTWSETVLFIFPVGRLKGYAPSGKLVFDGAGNLYGSTQFGGNDLTNCPKCGTVFQLKPPATAGGPWTQKVLHNFGSVANDGQSPLNGLLLRSGILYGTTQLGGTNNNGIVFQLVQKNGSWNESILYEFNGSDGSSPGGLIFGAALELYGVTTLGGGANCACGTIFRLSPPALAGDPWQETMLYSFLRHGDGATPFEPLWRDKLGNLYGTAAGGGVNNAGTVFKLKTPAVSGGNWTLVVLHDFLVGNRLDGSIPRSELIQRNGVFYGVTLNDGGSGEGTVYSLVP
jgi:uncharacterized repeat protein (TIGR03803 family)